MKFKIEFADEVKDHLKFLTALEKSLLKEQVNIQLGGEPEKETRNRFKMRSNKVAPWELRIGQLRVYYEVDVGQESKVRILAVGKKDRDQVYIGGSLADL